jgi:hypothetical protein
MSSYDDDEDLLGFYQEKSESLESCLENIILWLNAEKRGDKAEAERMMKQFKHELEFMDYQCKEKLPRLD